MNKLQQRSLEIGGQIIEPGQRYYLELKIPALFDSTEMKIPVSVTRGKLDGPILFISAAIHGDEINGTEAIKRLLGKKKLLSHINGTLVAIPVVNVFGFNNKVRYLPDRRDLNRCFPGSKNGSLGMQIAHIFMNEIVIKCTHGIDLHTGAIHRSNLAQIRTSLDSQESTRLAEAFNAPVVINASTRDGSLREAVSQLGIPMLLFEGGEALRYDEKVIKSAMSGIIRVMESIDMIDSRYIKSSSKKKDVYIARSSFWLRATGSGSLRTRKSLGSRIKAGELLGVISDPFGKNKVEVRAEKSGIVIGLTVLPLVNQGDAIFHIATFEDIESVKERIDEYDDDFGIS